MTLESFCTRVSNKSPCFTTELNCAFFRSGRFVSTIPPTLSILQCNLPAAINVDNSLQKNNYNASFTV